MLTATLLALTVVSCPTPDAWAIPIPPLEAPTPTERWTQVQAEVKRITAAQRFTGAKVGYAGRPSESYKAFESLLEVAEDADLDGLLSDPHPAVRLYAMWGLMKRGHDAKTVLARLPGQDETVSTQFGCVVRAQTVGAVAEDLARWGRR